MESLPISKLRFLTVEAEPIAAPQEWTPALIELSLPDDQWESASLRLQHRELPIRVTKIAGRKRVLADWPQANPGHYELRATWPGGQSTCNVTVVPRKISQDSFETLLDDLEVDLPVSVAMSLQQMGAFAGVEILPPGTSTIAQEMFRLRRAVQGTSMRAGLLTLLPDIGRRPHQILKANENWVRAADARRPHPARLYAAISRGDNYSETGQLQNVFDTRVEHTFDVHENRLVKAFVSQVERRLRVLHRLLTKKLPNSAECESVRTLWSSLRRAKREAPFLDGVGHSRHQQTRTTMVLLNRPSYRSALQGYLEFNKAAAVRFSEPRLDAPLDNVPALYQRWGSMFVIRALLEVGKQLGYRVLSQRLVERDFEGLCVRVLPDGRPAVELIHDSTGWCVRMTPERSFAQSGDIRSISFNQRPDISIEVRTSSGEVRLFLFDPKYKLRSEQTSGLTEVEDEGVPKGMPKKVDIDKMHSYRDAIRGQNLFRVVSYAAIIYPGPEKRYADDIEALQGFPGQAVALTARLKEVLVAAMS